MNRSYFSSTIKDFISIQENEILGTLTSSENIFSITPKTTYAWQGLIVFVPEGNIQDKTRDPKFYDGTYEFLINCGFNEL